MPQIKCLVVTPEKTTLDEWADFVALPLYDGEIGIATGHTPLIGRLGYGEMRLRTGDKVTRYYVDGGFAHVVENVVSVLTSRTIRADDIDTAVAQVQLQDALQHPAKTPESMEIRDRQVLQARGQLRVARRSR
jgi:F-type H+-transporting ATPase subunit epsilon